MSFSDSVIPPARSALRRRPRPSTFLRRKEKTSHNKTQRRALKELILSVIPRLTVGPMLTKYLSLPHAIQIIRCPQNLQAMFSMQTLRFRWDTKAF
jgi:hypothetical protein